MIFLFFFLALAVAEPSPLLRLVEAQDLYHVTTTFFDLVEENAPVVFHLAESGTFLAQKQLQFWDVERVLDDIGPVPAVGGGPEWVEWGYDDIAASEYLHSIPVSPCHSEVEGQGGAIYFRDIVATEHVRGATYGVNSDILLLTVQLSAGVSLAQGQVRSTTLTCSAKHGEIVQVFLRNTHFLSFTPRFRVLRYNPRRRRFRGPVAFLLQPRQKEIVANGVGELVCGSSAVMGLSCDAVIGDVREAPEWKEGEK